MLERVPPMQLSNDDLILLHAANNNVPASHYLELKDIVERLWQGEYQLFRCPQGVMLTEIAEFGKTRRLNLVRLSGKGLTLHFEEISRDLQHIAREFNCTAIETIVYSEKLARALSRGGAKQESVTMVLELENG